MYKYSSPFHYIIVLILLFNISIIHVSGEDNTQTRDQRSGEDRYIDPVNGLDSRSGNSPATAWQTFSNLNSQQLFPGDRILFSKYAGTEVKINGEEHLIMREDDILGIIEK